PPTATLRLTSSRCVGHHVVQDALAPYGAAPLWITFAWKSIMRAPSQCESGCVAKFHLVLYPEKYPGPCFTGTANVHNSTVRALVSGRRSRNDGYDSRHHVPGCDLHDDCHYVHGGAQNPQTTGSELGRRSVQNYGCLV